jgi:hypothetical protein
MGVIGSSANGTSNAARSNGCDGADESCKLLKISAQIATAHCRRTPVQAISLSWHPDERENGLLDGIIRELWSRRRKSAPGIDTAVQSNFAT